MYPPGIVTRTCTVGGSTALESGTPLALSAEITASRSLMWGATGWQFPSLKRTVTGSEGAELSFSLPVTDLAGWRLNDDSGSIIDVSTPGSYTHTYTIKLYTLQGGRPVAVRTIGPFVLPTEDLSPIDLDLMLPAPTVAGGVVLVPDSWSAQIAVLSGLLVDAVAALDSTDAAMAAIDADAGSALRTQQDARISADYGRALQIAQVAPRFGIKNYNNNPDFYTLRNVYHVWDSTVKNTGAVYGLSVPSSSTGAQSILRSIDGGISWTKLGSVTVNIAANELLEHIFVEPYYETILVVKNTNTASTSAEFQVLTLNNACAVLATHVLGVGRTWHGGMQSVDAVDKAGAGGTRIIMFAEYTNNNAASARIWKSEDKGLTWTAVLTKGANNGVVNAGEIRHFHCVQVDPFTRHWWASSGDTDAQCNVWRSTDEGATWQVIFSGDQQARTLGFVFENGFLYYGMDSPHPGAQSKIFRVDKTTLARTEVAAVPDGLAIYQMTRTFYPAGFLVWTADELGTADSTGVFFFDYRTQRMTSVFEFDGDGAAIGIQDASRYQDRETGLVWLRPASSLFRNAYGYGGTSSTLSEVLKARLV